MYGSLVITYILQINYYAITGPRFFQLSSLHHDCYMRVYTQLISICSTAFNHVVMGSRVIWVGTGIMGLNDDGMSK